MYLLARCWCCGAEWNYYNEFWWDKVGEVGFHQGDEGCPCCYSNLIILPMGRYWTERKALEVCRDLWRWLADNPDKWKWDWTEWKDNGGKIPNCKSHCPLCEYSNLHNLSCSSCLLFGEGKELEQEGNCLDDESSYWRWYYSKDSTVRKAMAFEIVAACNRSLEKLRKG